MSRDIKFRYYDAFNECFIYSDNTSLSKFFDMYEMATEGGNNPTLMQCTGLKDKNGAEIYEGDIVKWGDSPAQEFHHRYAVVEMFPSLQFKIIFYVDSKTLEREDGDSYVFEFGSFAYQNTDKFIEIVGNIHENTELLELRDEA